MENCTIYSHQLAFDKVIEIVKKSLPKARLDMQDNGLQKSLTATIKGGLFTKKKTLTINYRQRQNPSYNLDQVDCGLTKNLAGMVNFIQSIPAQKTNIRDQFLYKVMSANSEMAFIAEPNISGDFEKSLRKIVSAIDAYIFAQPSELFSKSTNQHFLDKDLQLIIDTEGNSEVESVSVIVDSKYHDIPASEASKDQIERKQKSETHLAENKIKVNKNLPCVEAKSNVVLRSKADIIDRAYALMIMGVKGEGIEQEYLKRTVAEKHINSFSPREEFTYKLENMMDEERAYATWRYESLNVMLWALRFMDELSYPSEICDVKAIVGMIFQPSRSDFDSKAKLRTKEEILDQLDKVYRMHWACVDARIKGVQVSGNINPSVIFERHYALNWLTNYENQDWDDVQTNT